MRKAGLWLLGLAWVGGLLNILLPRDWQLLPGFWACSWFMCATSFLIGWLFTDLLHRHERQQ